MVLKRSSMIAFVGFFVTTTVLLPTFSDTILCGIHNAATQSAINLSREGRFLWRRKQVTCYTFCPWTVWKVFSPPQQVIDHVEKLAFFFRYTRSGHTIMSKVLAANPNVSTGREFKVFNAAVISQQKHFGYFNHIFRLSQLHQCDQGMLTNRFSLKFIEELLL